MLKEIRGDDLTANIKRIFDFNIELIGNMDKSIYYFRRQQYDKALGILADSIDRMKYITDAIIHDREYFNLVATESVLEMFSGILEAKKDRDYILLADLLELQLMTFLLRVQELIIGKEELAFDEEKYAGNMDALLKHGVGLPELMQEHIQHDKLMENGYRVEFTSTGLMTLAIEKEGAKNYYHTNCRVQMEAFLLADTFYKPGIKKYIIYGLGMGYHIRELKDLAPEAEIEVYEADDNVIQLACVFTGIKELLEGDHITIYYDPDLKELTKRISNITSEETLGIHYPSLRNVNNERAKKIMEKIYPWSKTLEFC